MSERLRRLVVVYETEAACRARMAAAGFPPEVAAELAFYLAQATDFEALENELGAMLAATGVELVSAGLDERERWLPMLSAPGTLLWPLTDGFAYYRGSFLSSMAALHDVPQFGSPPAAQHLAQDKFRCLAVARGLGLDVPPTVLVEDGEPLAPLDLLPRDGPFFVKPATLGAKLGLDADSRTGDLTTARERARRIWARYRDRALIQPYVDGHDVRVSFLDVGDGRLRPAAYRILMPGRGFPTLADSRCITRLRAADGVALEVERVAHPGLLDAAQRLARVLELRDYWSIDFRLGSDGRAWFLELEVCPAVTIYDFLTYLRDVHDCGLPQAIARATPAAWQRRRAQSSP